MGIIGLISQGAGLAKLVLEKSNTKENRKYIDEYVDAEKEALEADRMVKLEKTKPQEDQLDNVIEFFEEKVKHLKAKSKILDTAARKELQRLSATKG